MPALRHDAASHLRVRVPSGAVDAVVLVLHGGRADSTEPTRPWQSAVLRMVPFAREVRRTASDVAVALVRYRVRGWNGAAASPVVDAREAVDELTRRFPGAPVALIGHSLGGRTALRIADNPAVRAVAALAPWLPPGEPIPDVRNRWLLLAHGNRDRTTNPVDSAEYAQRARAAGAHASFVSVTADGHAMLRRSGVWHRLATAYVLGALGVSVPPDGPVGEVVTRALAGEPQLVI